MGQNKYKIGLSVHTLQCIVVSARKSWLRKLSILTLKCTFMCQCTSQVFIVLGIYNFGEVPGPIVWVRLWILLLSRDNDHFTFHVLSLRNSVIVPHCLLVPMKWGQWVMAAQLSSSAREWGALCVEIGFYANISRDWSCRKWSLSSFLSSFNSFRDIS